jgi:hypothetical protein
VAGFCCAQYTQLECPRTFSTIPVPFPMSTARAAKQHGAALATVSDDVHVLESLKRG